MLLWKEIKFTIVLNIFSFGGKWHINTICSLFPIAPCWICSAQLIFKPTLSTTDPHKWEGLNTSQTGQFPLSEIAISGFNVRYCIWRIVLMEDWLELFATQHILKWFSFRDVCFWMIASPAHKLSVFKKWVKYENLKRSTHWDCIRNVFMFPGYRAIRACNLPGTLTRSHNHKEKKGSWRWKRKSENELGTKSHLGKHLKAFSPHC